MELPRTANDFISFMEEVWGGKIEPTEDGGVVITGSPLYNDWHDARLVAKRMGLTRLYSSRSKNGNEYHYNVPDGSRVAIGVRGSSIREVNKHFS